MPVTSQQLVKCERCRSFVRSDRLKKHMRNVHPPRWEVEEEREERTSVLTVSGGGFETNRRRH